MVEKIHLPVRNGELKADYHYKKREKEALDTYLENFDITKQSLNNLRKFVFKDIKEANRVSLLGNYDRLKQIVVLVKKNNKKYFDILKKKSLIDKNGNLKSKEKIGSVGAVILLQVFLNIYLEKNYKGEFKYLKKHIDIDGKFGMQTFRALIYLQKYSKKYSEKHKGGLDAIAGKDVLGVISDELKQDFEKEREKYLQNLKKEEEKLNGLKTLPKKSKIGNIEVDYTLSINSLDNLQNYKFKLAFVNYINFLTENGFVYGKKIDIKKVKIIKKEKKGYLLTFNDGSFQVLSYNYFK